MSRQSIIRVTLYLVIALAALFGLVVFLNPVPSPESGTNYFDGIDKDANAETQSDFHRDDETLEVPIADGSGEFPSIDDLERECGYFIGDTSESCLTLLKRFNVSLESDPSIDMEEVFEHAASDRQVVSELMDNIECRELSSGPIRLDRRAQCFSKSFIRHEAFLRSCPRRDLHDRPPGNDFNIETYLADLQRLEDQRIEDQWLNDQYGSSLYTGDSEIRHRKFTFYFEGWNRIRCDGFLGLFDTVLPGAPLNLIEFGAQRGLTEQELEFEIYQRSDVFWELDAHRKTVELEHIWNVLARLGIEPFLSHVSYSDEKFVKSMREAFPLHYFRFKCGTAIKDAFEPLSLKDCLHGQYFAHTLDQATENDVKTFAMRTAGSSEEERREVVQRLIDEGVPYEFFSEILPEDDDKYRELVERIRQTRGLRTPK